MRKGQRRVSVGDLQVPDHQVRCVLCGHLQPVEVHGGSLWRRRNVFSFWRGKLYPFSAICSHGYNTTQPLIFLLRSSNILLFYHFPSGALLHDYRHSILLPFFVGDPIGREGCQATHYAASDPAAQKAILVVNELDISKLSDSCWFSKLIFDPIGQIPKKKVSSCIGSWLPVSVIYFPKLYLNFSLLSYIRSATQWERPRY